MLFFEYFQLKYQKKGICDTKYIAIDKQSRGHEHVGDNKQKINRKHQSQCRKSLLLCVSWRDNNFAVIRE